MGATGALASSQVKSYLLASPNDTVRLAVVGVRGQGKSHLNQYSQMKNVEIAAICDIDESILNDRLNMVEGKTGKKPASYWEIRRRVSCSRLVFQVARYYRAAAGRAGSGGSSL